MIGSGQNLRWLLLSTACLGYSPQALAQDGRSAVAPLAPQEAADAAPGDEIVVTARLRKETIVTTPVAVAALSSEDIGRYKTDTFTKVAEMTPGLTVGASRMNGGGTIAIRGIGTSAEQTGGDQAVSTAIDGIQVNSGRLAIMGFFDLQQVEVLKGPQALMFGKNSSAGVISLTSAGVTDRLTGHIRAGYEFVADEKLIEGAVSGPLTDTLGARLAFRYRNSEGWLYNDARARNNPFFPSVPYQDPVKKRLGDNELLGRLTLEYRPSSDLNVVLKVFGDHAEDAGTASLIQVVGCVGPVPVTFGVQDFQNECTADNHVTSGEVPATFVKDIPLSNGGVPYGKFDAVISSLKIEGTVGPGTLTSISGFTSYHSVYSGASDLSSFSQVFSVEDTRQTMASQELRYLSNFDGMLNFMAGLYYQHVSEKLHKPLTIRQDLNYNPANGSFIGADMYTTLTSNTYSAFGQLILKPLEAIEIAGGVRWTHDTKDFTQYQAYAFGSGFGSDFRLAGNLSDSNFSPEVTVSWHPTPLSTIYAAYKTGYKAGGFGTGSPLRATATINNVNYKSEHAKGFEIGAKAELFDRLLRVMATFYNYKFTDLQVTTYDPISVSIKFSNASFLKQYGADFQMLMRPARGVELRGAVNWSHNRYGQLVGQCYVGQTAATGCSITPGPLQDLTGKSPPRSPAWSGSGGFSFDAPLPNDMTLSFDADAFYTASYFAGDTQSPRSFQGAFWRLNAGVRLSGANDRWEVGLVGRNLTNKYYITTSADRIGGTGEQRAAVARGREVMLELNYNF